MDDLRLQPDDPFLLTYKPEDLRIASEFLTNWLPFLSRDLCDKCTQILSDRVRSINPEHNGDTELRVKENSRDSASNCVECYEINDNNDDNSDTNSLGSWKDGANGEPTLEASTSKLTYESPINYIPKHPMSWADMAQEDELEEEEEQEVRKRVINMNASTGELKITKVAEKPKLSREQREDIRFTSVQRKKDFICLERINGGKICNILEGLELHTGIFSAAEQKRIVDLVYVLKEKGEKRELRERTYSAPRRWKRGKGRVTIQFGCCYNYATDKKGNEPGILQNEMVDPMPRLFKEIIRRLVRWHVLPPTCVPDSCIVNIYEEGDSIPPHIDNHDFVRPFCTVSFLSECDILFGTDLKVVGAGEFEGSFAIPLPVGSVLVLNGNGADVAKHCVPAVPRKRISITFRKMDESKWPTGFVPEPDFQGIQPLPNDLDKRKRVNSSRSEHHWHPARREGKMETRGYAERSGSYSDPYYSTRTRRGLQNGPKVRVNLGS